MMCGKASPFRDGASKKIGGTASNQKEINPGKDEPFRPSGGRSRISLIRISSAAPPSTLTGATLIILSALATFSSLTALSLWLDFGSRDQAQLTVGHHLLSGLQSVVDHGHGVGRRAGLNDSHFAGLIG